MSNAAQIDYSTADRAADNGHIHVLAWLHSIGADFSNVMCAAARAGRIEVLEWTQKETCLRPHDWIYTEAAAEGGHLDALKWLREIG